MGRQKRDKESLEIELEEKKHVIKRYESEFKEANSQKIFMKKQLDEYESKIKKLIKEFEDESKKHINEIKDLHDHYRGYKTTSFELEQRISNYKTECEKAIKGEREAKKSVNKLTLQNDELTVKLSYLEKKYNQMIARLGASEEDI
mmetsp:Transcript_22126/g.21328  ORF Transcript_22126/g.21328 Transcript_22126/m.21328 type:complete len:146 (+) Transcript_22126:661-1098(+)